MLCALSDSLALSLSLSSLALSLLSRPSLRSAPPSFIEPCCLLNGVQARYRRMMKVGMMKEEQARKHEVATEQRARLNESRRVSAMLMRHKYYNPQCPVAKASSLSIPAVHQKR